MHECIQRMFPCYIPLLQTSFSFLWRNPCPSTLSVSFYSAAFSLWSVDTERQPSLAERSRRDRARRHYTERHRHDSVTPVASFENPKWHKSSSLKSALREFKCHSDSVITHNPTHWGDAVQPTHTHTHTGELPSLWITRINHFPLTHLYSKLQRVLKLISVMTHTTQTQSPEPDNHPCNSQHAVGLHQYLLKLPQHRLVLIYITVNWAVETQYTSEHLTHARTHAGFHHPVQAAVACW